METTTTEPALHVRVVDTMLRKRDPHGDRVAVRSTTARGTALALVCGDGRVDSIAARPDGSIVLVSRAVRLDGDDRWTTTEAMALALSTLEVPT